ITATLQLRRSQNHQASGKPTGKELRGSAILWGSRVYRRNGCMSVRSQPFEQLLLECIDEGPSVLGNEPRQALYQYLLAICSLPREEIPGRVPEFAAGLRKSLGGASKVIERMILRKLFQKIGSSFRET